MVFRLTGDDTQIYLTKDIRRVVGLDRRGQLHARPGLQRELAVRNAITRDLHRLDRNRNIRILNRESKRRIIRCGFELCLTSGYMPAFLI